MEAHSRDSLHCQFHVPKVSMRMMAETATAARRPMRPLFQQANETGNSAVQKAKAGARYRLTGCPLWPASTAGVRRPTATLPADPSRKKTTIISVIAAGFTE